MEYRVVVKASLQMLETAVNALMHRGEWRVQGGLVIYRDMTEPGGPLRYGQAVVRETRAAS